MALINCNECNKQISDKAEFCIGCGAPTFSILKSIPINNSDFVNIIGTSIKIGNLEVAEHDFPNRMEWENAKIVCSKLGNGWRLPSNVELNILYRFKDKIGGFTDFYYWSFTEGEEGNGYSHYQKFELGTWGAANIHTHAYVRAVRFL